MNDKVKIIEYNVIRTVPEFQFLNSAKILYVRKDGIFDQKYESFINKAIGQVFKVMGYREVTDLDILRNEVRNDLRGVFHIQYEPDTDKIDLYTTAMELEGKEWPVYDIPFPMFEKSKGDGLDIIFKEEISMMKYDWTDIPSAKEFIQGLKNELVNPFPIIS